MITRRRFLGYGAGVSCLSLSGAMPRLLAQAAAGAAAADRNDRVLLVIELSGGNDGLNTLVPFGDPLYYEYRPTLALAKDELVRLSDQVGLHPALAPLGELFRQGQVAVVQGVGYPEPDRSHFRSTEIWHTASTRTTPPTSGWLGRFLDGSASPAGDELPGLALTGSLPQALQAEQIVVPVVAQLDAIAGDDGSPQQALVRQLSTSPEGAADQVAFMRRQAEAVYRTADRLRTAAAAYRSTVEYPPTGLGEQLRRSAQVVSADLGVRVLYASQDGYDTHADQAGGHAALLGDLAGSLGALQQDLAALGVADRTAVMVFSEFGRRVDENASRGTDHGAASVMFVVGAGVQGGLYGAYPSLQELGDGDLVFNTDFRRVYATLLEGWLGCPAAPLLDGEFARMDIIPS